MINDQYRSVQGSMRFLNNIVRYSGCGAFSPQVSHVVVDRTNREFVALVLGSRVSAAERPHHPGLRPPRLPPPRHGPHAACLAGFRFMRQGATEISLTVTEANREAIDLYLSKRYACRHSFDAAVWQRQAANCA